MGDSPVYETLPGGEKRVVATIKDGRVIAAPPRPLPQGSSLYKYLTKREWMHTWIRGGEIPIFPASYYRSMERNGVFTPDEVVQAHNFGMSPADRAVFTDGPGLTVILDNVAIADENGARHIAKGISSVSEEHSLIECYCLSSLRANRRRFGKESCVRIVDPIRLKKVLDEQIGEISVGGCIDYTPGPNRHHFLKGLQDSWQHEYRFAWIGLTEMRTVVLPAGIAEPVTAYP